MLTEQRLAIIRDVLQDQGVVSIQQISDRIGASFSTVRRDLDLLAQEGLIARTRGGATLRGAPVSLDLGPGEAPASGPMLRAKIAIGAAVAAEVEDGQSVIFDSGLTVLEAARCVVERRLRITAVTNSIKTAQILAQGERVRLIVVGGTLLRPGSATLVGEPGLCLLARMRADLALINTQAIEGGHMAHKDMEVASMVRQMMAGAQRSLLLADSWKFGRAGFFRVCPLTDFDAVVTDDGLSAAEQAGTLAGGARLRVVPVTAES